MKWAIFLTLTIWFYLLLSLLTRRKRRVSERLREHLFETPQKAQQVSVRSRIPVWYRILGRPVKGWMSRWPRRRLDRVQLRLTRAHSRWTVGEWIALQLVFFLGATFLDLFFLVFVGIQVASLALALTILALSWVVPEFWLSRRITIRQNTLRRQLPSTLDLLTVSVEAGLGFDQALSKVVDEMTGPIAEETDRVLHEMQLGTPRMQALQRLADRTGVDVIELFVSAVVQADKLGVGLTRVLRIQAEEVRRKQRAAAQEMATKAPVKILFPLVLFVFPALFVVILGPAVLHIAAMFAHNG